MGVLAAAAHDSVRSLGLHPALMADSGEQERQLRLVMHMIAELAPGSVCMDSSCPQSGWSGMPHMANDGGPHPRPYGVVETTTHEWRRRPWWRRAWRR